jgi:hypothetical protein
MQTPTALALLLAERIYQDRETKSFVIAGVFNTLAFPRLPARQDRLEIFFQVTSVSRPVDLKLRLEHAETQELVMNVGGPISGNSPLDVLPRRVVVRGLTISRAGKYWLQLVSSETIVTQVPVYVKVGPTAETPPSS